MNSILLLLASFHLCSCQTFKTKFIPDIEVCSEIPFVDGAEGACGTNLSKEQRIVPPAEWEEMKPEMIMIHAESWSKIKLSWKKACRYMKSNCDHEVESIDSLIRGISEIAEEIRK